MSSDATKAYRYGSRDLVNTFGQGRTCTEEQCTALLSRYNDEDRCGVHAAGDGRRRR